MAVHSDRKCRILYGRRPAIYSYIAGDDLNRLLCRPSHRRDNGRISAPDPAAECLVELCDFVLFQILHFFYDGSSKATWSRAEFADIGLGLAGPIERPQNLLHQFARAVTFDASRFRTSAKLMH